MMVCIECDLVITPHAEPGPSQRVECPRCDHVLARGAKSPEDTVMALSITAIISLIVSISFPFLSFEIQGQSNQMSLLSVAEQLTHSGYIMLAIAVIAFMVLLPLVYLLALFTLVLKTKTDTKTGNVFLSSKLLANIVSKIFPWLMVDVFIFGVLVALVKILGMAEVVLGTSFWSYIVFTIVFIKITSIVDTHRLWGWVDSYA